MSEQKPKRESTSIKIDPDLWKEAKIEAIRRDMEVSELVEQSLRKELGKQEIALGAKAIKKNDMVVPMIDKISIGLRPYLSDKRPISGVEIN